MHAGHLWALIFAIAGSIPAHADIKEVRAALRETFPDWEFIRFDESPGPVTDGVQGFRIALRWAEETDMPARDRLKLPEIDLGKPPDLGGAALGRGLKLGDKPEAEEPDDVMEVLYHYVDLVLCPEASCPSDLKTRVKWEDRDQPHFSMPIALGQGMGFRWVGNLPIPLADDLRFVAKLQGGDDGLLLAVEGLGVDDHLGWTMNRCVGMVAEAGDAAVAPLRAALWRHAATDPLPFVRPLGLVHTPASTQLLRELYAWPDERLSAAAELALLHRPYRPEAKAEYLDMLGKQHSVEELAKAAVELKWQEAIPVLRQVCAAPARWSHYRAAYEAARALEGKPIPPDILDAERKLTTVPPPNKPLSPERADGLVTLLSRAGDKEAAAVAAVTIALRWGRGIEEATRRRGRAIWRALPDEAKQPLLAPLQGIEYEVDKQHIQELLEG